MANRARVAGAKHPESGSHGRPLEREFYKRVRAGALKLSNPRARIRIPDWTGSAIRVSPGEFIRIVLLEGPQIVNLFAVNPGDPDERLWTQNTLMTESAFLREFSRVWSTMPRFRPALTVLEDTLGARESPSGGKGRHHFVIGGWQTSAEWESIGGPPGVPSVWDRLAAALRDSGLPASLLKDTLALFQRVRVDRASNDLTILPSRAVAGDRLTFFAEIRLILLVALSPYREGGLSADKLDGTVRAVDVEIYPALEAPLPWPYPGLPYPDLNLYINSDGVRTSVPGPTPGLV